MKTNKMKIWIGCGIFCVLSLFLSTWYAVTFNDSRLVVPMDFKDYVFRAKDLPMILSISLICIYVISLFVMLFVYAGEKQRQVEEFCVDKMATLIEKFNPNEYERNYLKEQAKSK